MLLAAAFRQQADGYVIKCCEAASEESSDYVAASKLFQRAAGIYSYIDRNLLSSEEKDGSKWGSCPASSFSLIVRASKR